ncbi:MAG: phage tail assembly protein [Calditrichaeota bacterium]|nr:phage tail assembly protein [Calditrichota bacterium]
MAFRTEVEFTLPKGYLDEEGNLHKKGVMRLATAGDEILPLRDPRVQQNPAYLTMIVLSRVITRLGSLESIHPQVIEKLYASDLSYLQALYQKINGDGRPSVKASCPKCEHSFEVEMSDLGEV